LGHQACVMGYRTLYLNLNRFIEKIMIAKLDGSFVKLLNQIEKESFEKPIVKVANTCW
jgi:hypothetical protein